MVVASQVGAIQRLVVDQVSLAAVSLANPIDAQRGQVQHVIGGIETHDQIAVASGAVVVAVAFGEITKGIAVASGNQPITAFAAYQYTDANALTRRENVVACIAVENVIAIAAGNRIAFGGTVPIGLLGK